MEVGRRRRAADLKSQQSHLAVNSLLNGQPVQRVQQRRGVGSSYLAPGGQSEQRCSAHAATSGWCRLEHRGAQRCSDQSGTGSDCTPVSVQGPSSAGVECDGRPVRGSCMIVPLSRRAY